MSCQPEQAAGSSWSAAQVKHLRISSITIKTIKIVNQPYHLHRGTEKVPSKTNNHIIYHHRYHYYQHCQHCQPYQPNHLYCGTVTEKVSGKTWQPTLLSIRLQINQIHLKQKKYFV